MPAIGSSKILSVFQQTNLATADTQKLFALASQHAAILKAYQQNAALFQHLAAMPNLTALASSKAYQQITADIYPAMEYLQQEHTEVYEQVADLLPSIPAPPAKKAKRQRAIEAARQLTIRAEIASWRLQERWLELSDGRFELLVSFIAKVADTLDEPLKSSINSFIIFLYTLFIATHSAKDGNNQ